MSLEILTVFLAGPIAVYIAWLMASNTGLGYTDKRFVQSHFWTVVLSVMELYGGWMTFVPEWITGSTQLRTGKSGSCTPVIARR